MASFIVIASVILFIMAYRIYGRWLSRQWGVNNSIPTPAHTRKDGIDFVPAPLPVLFGHHFASIAGAAPIIGPIAASIFGWLPVLLWIVFAAIFIGMVHDFGALFASIRHQGQDLSKVIKENIGSASFKIFSLYIWLTSLLVIAAFVNVVSETFVKSPAAASCSSMFVFVAILLGFMLNKMKMPLIPATAISLIFMLISIWLGSLFPIALSMNLWLVIVLVYIVISSVTPIWLLLQPRDYLNSFFLLALIILSVGGVLLVNPEIKMPAFTGFVVEATETLPARYLFPFLFVTVACGAISGYHSMFASATTSKQLNRESDALPVAAGGMLVEAVLAIIALLVAAGFSSQEYASLSNPITIFSTGLSNMLTVFHLPQESLKSFIILTVSSFALTSLDSVARVARFILQNICEDITFMHNSGANKLLENKYFASILTVTCGGALGLCDWKLIWPIFGCANQLIALFTFVVMLTWLKRHKRRYGMIIIPMIIMFCITTAGLFRLTWTSYLSESYLLTALAIGLIIITIVFIVNSRLKPKNAK